jgi:hypothetical protein
VNRVAKALPSFIYDVRILAVDFLFACCASIEKSFAQLSVAVKISVQL